jgi:hypothetical protein
VFQVLLDTSVWLELGKDPKQAPILNVIEEMVARKLVALIVPRVVHTEFTSSRPISVSSKTRWAGPA